MHLAAAPRIRTWLLCVRYPSSQTAWSCVHDTWHSHPSKPNSQFVGVSWPSQGWTFAFQICARPCKTMWLRVSQPRDFWKINNPITPMLEFSFTPCTLSWEQFSLNSRACILLHVFYLLSKPIELFSSQPVERLCGWHLQSHAQNTLDCMERISQSRIKKRSLHETKLSLSNAVSGMFLLAPVPKLTRTFLFPSVTAKLYCTISPSMLTTFSCQSELQTFPLLSQLIFFIYIYKYINTSSRPLSPYFSLYLPPTNYLPQHNFTLKSLNILQNLPFPLDLQHHPPQSFIFQQATWLSLPPTRELQSNLS